MGDGGRVIGNDCQGRSGGRWPCSGGDLRLQLGDDFLELIGGPVRHGALFKFGGLFNACLEILWHGNAKDGLVRAALVVSHAENLPPFHGMESFFAERVFLYCNAV